MTSSIRRFRSDFELSSLPASDRLRPLTFTDPIDLPQDCRKGLVEWLPLLHGPASEVAELDIDAVRLIGARLPPSLFQGRMSQPGLLVLFGMTSDHRSFVNGLALPPDSLVFGATGSFFLAHWPLETAPLQSVVAIDVPLRRVSPEWPTTTRLFGVAPVDARAMEHLRETVRETILLAAQSAHLFADERGRAAHADRLIEAITACFRTGSPLVEHGRGTLADHVDTYEKIVEFVDSNCNRPFTMRDVASELRISERTIHTVMTRLQGMTLKSYLKLQRLREVYRNLLHGDADFLVKQAAIRHGFMHQGRFAGEYMKYFGESPSATLARRVKT